MINENLLGCSLFVPGEGWGVVVALDDQQITVEFDGEYEKPYMETEIGSFTLGVPITDGGIDLVRCSRVLREVRVILEVSEGRNIIERAREIMQERSLMKSQLDALRSERLRTKLQIWFPNGG
jgi:hypothetical protein